jgi:hypothetical protein
MLAEDPGVDKLSRGVIVWIKSLENPGEMQIIRRDRNVGVVLEFQAMLVGRSMNPAATSAALATP